MMTVEELENFYKNGYRFCKATTMSAVSFSNWKKWGYIPLLSQIKIERLTKGQLKADRSMLIYEDNQ